MGHKKTAESIKARRVLLKNIVLHPGTREAIQELVLKANEVDRHARFMLKMFLLDKFSNGESHVIVDKTLIMTMMRVLVVNKGRQCTVNYDLFRTLSDFFENNYKPCAPNFVKVDGTGMGNIFDYMAVTIITDYENNIKANYFKYIEQFVNFTLRQYFEVYLQDQGGLDALGHYIRHAINYIKLGCQGEVPQGLEGHIRKIVPCHVLDRQPPRRLVVNDNVLYDLKAHPWDYFPCMIYIATILERIFETERSRPKATLVTNTEAKKTRAGKKHKKRNIPRQNVKIISLSRKIRTGYISSGANRMKLYNPFPLNTSTIPHHIIIDSATVAFSLRNSGEIQNRTRSEYIRTSGAVAISNLHRIWNDLFRTDGRVFRKKNCTFNSMISTDGIGCSILFGSPAKIKVETLPEQYIEEYKPEGLRKRIVGIDPNMRDIVYCAGEADEGVKFIRYTQNQVNFESKQKRIKRITRKIKTKASDRHHRLRRFILSIRDIESHLSKHDSKTVDMGRYKAYLRVKNEANIYLCKFYGQELFRKMKLRTKVNRQRSEQLMINHFKEKFGGPDEAVISFGDFSTGDHKKFHEPVKRKGLRTLFRRAGYQVYLFDEYRTSCRCFNCGSQGVEGTCETFRVVSNPRPFRSENVYRHGLVRCSDCQTVWDRDKNSSLNILFGSISVVEGKGRPKYLARSCED